MGDRERLRQTFDAAAARYHDARPDYPDALYDDLVRLAALAPGARLLEVGAGTGKATLALARRGFRIDCLELGEHLASEAARNLAGYPLVQVVSGSFDDWDLGDREPFDLVYAATAWHWLDPACRYRRAFDALAPGGSLAFWSALHVVPDGGDPFFANIQPVYDEIGEGMPPGGGFPRPGELPDLTSEIEESGLFGDVEVRHHDWELTYDAESYIDLLRTFSGHLAMPEWKQSRLYEAIRTLVSTRDEQPIRRHWGAVLHVARRRG